VILRSAACLLLIAAAAGCGGKSAAPPVEGGPLLGKGSNRTAVTTSTPTATPAATSEGLSTAQQSLRDRLASDLFLSCDPAPSEQTAGIEAAEFAWFAEHPCPPDVIGINHYLSSERFLDHRLERYPTWSHGGNGRDTYADVEAVRLLAEGIDGVGSLLTEAWHRYGRPVAVSEAFLGAPRHDQVRWLQAVWEAATAARARGVPVRSVTIWSLLGVCEWESLVTRCAATYEPGAFDLSLPGHPESVLAGWIQATLSGRQPLPTHPGWWETDARLLYPPASIAPLAARSEESRAGLDGR